MQRQDVKGGAKGSNEAGRLGPTCAQEQEAQRHADGAVAAVRDAQRVQHVEARGVAPLRQRLQQVEGGQVACG